MGKNGNEIIPSGKYTHIDHYDEICYLTISGIGVGQQSRNQRNSRGMLYARNKRIKNKI